MNNETNLEKAVKQFIESNTNESSAHVFAMILGIVGNVIIDYSGNADSKTESKVLNKLLHSKLSADASIMDKFIA